MTYEREQDGKYIDMLEQRVKELERELHYAEQEIRSLESELSHSRSCEF